MEFMDCDDSMTFYFRCEGFVSTGVVEKTRGSRHHRVSDLIMKAYQGFGYMHRLLIKPVGNQMVMLTNSGTPCQVSDFAFTCERNLPDGKVYGSAETPFRIFVKEPPIYGRLRHQIDMLLAFEKIHFPDFRLTEKNVPAYNDKELVEY